MNDYNTIIMSHTGYGNNVGINENVIFRGNIKNDTLRWISLLHRSEHSIRSNEKAAQPHSRDPEYSSPTVCDIKHSVDSTDNNDTLK